MVAALPELAAEAEVVIDALGAAGLEAFHQAGETGIAQRQQPVQMIRHDDPGEAVGQPLLPGQSHFVDQQAGSMEIGQHGPATVYDGGDEVDAPVFRGAPVAKAGRVGGEVVRHSIALR
ncbi:hypothetical protein D3C81_1777230 [compost metagenome]